MLLTAQPVGRLSQFDRAGGDAAPRGAALIEGLVLQAELALGSRAASGAATLRPLWPCLPTTALTASQRSHTRHVAHPTADLEHATSADATSAVAIDAAGRSAVSAVRGSLCRWDVGRRERLGAVVSVHVDEDGSPAVRAVVSSIALDAEGTIALVGCSDGAVSCWQAEAHGGLRRAHAMTALPAASPAASQSAPSTDGEGTRADDDAAVRALALSEAGLAMAVWADRRVASWAWAGGKTTLRALGTLSSAAAANAAPAEGGGGAKRGGHAKDGGAKGGGAKGGGAKGGGAKGGGAKGEDGSTGGPSTSLAAAAIAYDAAGRRAVALASNRRSCVVEVWMVQADAHILQLVAQHAHLHARPVDAICLGAALAARRGGHAAALDRLAASASGTSLQVWSVADGVRLASLQADEGWPYASLSLRGVREESHLLTGGAGGLLGLHAVGAADPARAAAASASSAAGSAAGLEGGGSAGAGSAGSPSKRGGGSSSRASSSRGGGGGGGTAPGTDRAENTMRTGRSDNMSARDAASALQAQLEMLQRGAAATQAERLLQANKRTLTPAAPPLAERVDDAYDADDADARRPPLDTALDMLSWGLDTGRSGAESTGRAAGVEDDDDPLMLLAEQQHLLDDLDADEDYEA